MDLGSMFVCREHPGEVLEYWCKECEHLVCKSCLILGAHHGHHALPAKGVRKEERRDTQMGRRETEEGREGEMVRTQEERRETPQGSREGTQGRMAVQNGVRSRAEGENGIRSVGSAAGYNGARSVEPGYNGPRSMEPSWPVGPGYSGSRSGGLGYYRSRPGGPGNNEPISGEPRINNSGIRLDRNVHNGVRAVHNGVRAVHNGVRAEGPVNGMRSDGMFRARSEGGPFHNQARVDEPVHSSNRYMEMGQHFNSRRETGPMSPSRPPYMEQSAASSQNVLSPSRSRGGLVSHAIRQGEQRFVGQNLSQERDVSMQGGQRFVGQNLSQERDVSRESVEEASQMLSITQLVSDKGPSLLKDKRPSLQNDKESSLLSDKGPSRPTLLGPPPLSTQPPPTLLGQPLSSTQPPPIFHSPPTSLIYGLVSRLSSTGVALEAKKTGLVQLTSLPPGTLTEVLVGQLLEDQAGLIPGLKALIRTYREHETNFRREALLLGLRFFNQCLGLQRQSRRLRNLVFNLSRELSQARDQVSGLSLLQELVLLADPKEGRLTEDFCQRLTKELAELPPSDLIGKCTPSAETPEQILGWVRTCLGVTVGASQSSVVRNFESVYSVLELSLVQNGEEIVLSDTLLARSPDSGLWPARHPVRPSVGLVGAQTRGWCSVRVVRVLSSGHLLAYTERDYAARLARLEQELEAGVRRMASSFDPEQHLKPGLMVSVTAEKFMSDTQPISRFEIARGLILSPPTQTHVKLYLVDHGVLGLATVAHLRPLPPSLATLSPRLSLCRLQGVAPAPDPTLLVPAMTALSLVCNSRSGICLVTRPTLATPRILTQLLATHLPDLLVPTVSVLHNLATSQETCKHLTTTPNPPVAVELILPSLFQLLSRPSLPPGTLSQALEAVHSLLTPLNSLQLADLFCSGELESLLTKLSLKTEGQHAALVTRIFELGPANKAITPDRPLERTLPRQEVGQRTSGVLEGGQRNIGMMEVGNRNIGMLELGQRSTEVLGRGQEESETEVRVNEEERGKIKEDSIRIFKQKMESLRKKNASSETESSSSIKNGVSSPMSSSGDRSSDQLNTLTRVANQICNTTDDEAKFPVPVEKSVCAERTELPHVVSENLVTNYAVRDLELSQELPSESSGDLERLLGCKDVDGIEEDTDESSGNLPGWLCGQSKSDVEGSVQSHNILPGWLGGGGDSNSKGESEDEKDLPSWLRDSEAKSDEDEGFCGKDEDSNNSSPADIPSWLAPSSSVKMESAQVKSEFIPNKEVTSHLTQGIVPTANTINPIVQKNPEKDVMGLEPTLVNVSAPVQTKPGSVIGQDITPTVSMVQHPATSNVSVGQPHVSPTVRMGELNIVPMGEQAPRRHIKASSEAVWRQSVEIDKKGEEREKVEKVLNEESKKCEEEQEFLIRDYILSEKHDVGAELWDAEKLYQIDRDTLATLVCGFLNSEAGGTIYIGVKRTGLVRGVLLDRGQRDKVRQLLDKVLANQINPRVAPRIVDIDFIEVKEGDMRRQRVVESSVVRVQVGGRAGRDRVYLAHNLTDHTLGEGAYLRRGAGPDFNTKMSHQELIKISNNNSM